MRSASSGGRRIIKRKLYIFGFTDSSGDRETNDYVSKNRCSNCALYLSRQFGIDRTYLEVIGMPEGYEAPDGPASELRRVEFSFSPSHSPTDLEGSTASAPTTYLQPVSYDYLYPLVKKVYFKSRQVTPAKSDRDNLSGFGSAFLLEEIEGNIVLYGYSDGKGSAAANEWVTEERCKEVAKVLIRAGVPSDRIVIKPLQKTIVEAKVVADIPNQKTEGSAKGEDEEKPEVNLRRIEILIEKVTETPEGEVSSAPEGEEPPKDDVPPASDDVDTSPPEEGASTSVEPIE